MQAVQPGLSSAVEMPVAEVSASPFLPMERHVMLFITDRLPKGPI